MSLSNLSPFFTLLKVLSHCFSSLESFQSFVILFKCFGLRELMFFFSLNSFHNTRLFFFPSLGYLPCVLCVVTSRGFTPYFHNCPYSYHRCLLPPTSTITICSHMPTPTYFCHCCLLLPTCSHLLVPTCFRHRCLLLPLSPVLVSCLLLLTSSPTFTIATFSCLLLPTSSPTFAITTFSHLLSPSLLIHVYFHHCHLLVLAFATYSCLLPPLPPTCFHHHRLFSTTSIIVTSLGTLPLACLSLLLACEL